MSLQTKIKQIGTALYNALGSKVYHYYRPDGEIPAVVWQEDGERNTSFYSGNHKTEQALVGTIDYFTREEYDQNADVIQQTLDTLGGAWSLESVQYEPDTKLIHYEWRWVVIADGTVVPNVTPEPEAENDGNS